MSKQRRILLGLGALVILAGATVLPITLANAAPTKIYDLTMAPASVPADGASHEITATFKNATPSGNSSINSLKLFANAPSGFTITGASGIGNEVLQPGGQSVFVSNIPPVKNGRTYVLTMTVTTPAAADCNGSTVTWKAEQSGSSTVWTGSSFSGDTFAPNNVTANTTDLSVTCSVAFDKEPADALKTTVITSVDGDISGDPVQVSGIPGAIFGNQQVTLSIANDSPDSLASASSLTGNIATANASGVATFPSLMITESGDYKLVASANGYDSASSATFTISDGVIDCGQTVTTTNANDESLTASVTQTDEEGCAPKPYTFTHNGDSVQFLYPTGGTTSKFTVRVTSFAPEPVPNGAIPMTTVDVDASGPNVHPIQWCNTDANGPVLPSGEVTCLVSQSTVTLATDQIQVTETYYLEGDILYKR